MAGASHGAVQVYTTVPRLQRRHRLLNQYRYVTELFHLTTFYYKPKSKSVIFSAMRSYSLSAWAL